MELTEEVLILRLQKIKCCIATLSSELVSKIKIGAPTVDCKLRDLQALIGMYESIKCYSTSATVTCTNQTLEVLSGTGTGYQTILVNDVEISNSVNMIGSPADQALDIANSINSFQSTYTATVDNATITIAPLSGCLTILTSVRTDFPGKGAFDYTISNIEVLTPSLASNCLTEDQVKSVLDYAAVKCESCFELTI